MRGGAARSALTRRRRRLRLGSKPGRRRPVRRSAGAGSTQWRSARTRAAPRASRAPRARPPARARRAARRPTRAGAPRRPWAAGAPSSAASQPCPPESPPAAPAAAG
eukprot:scaffold7551_cov123-Isochrysis_galbana.AAC.17